MRRPFRAKSAREYLVGPRTIEVTDEGLRLTSPAGESLVRWHVVKSVDEGPAHLFVRYGYGLGPVIPKRFMTADDCAALVTQLRTKAEAARTAKV
jgi:hypothetical protein